MGVMVGALKRAGRLARLPDAARSPAGELPRALATLGAAVTLLLILARTMPNVWWRMAVFYAIAAPAAMLSVRLDWKGLLRPGLGKIAAGAVAAVALYLLAGIGFRIVVAIDPDLAAQAGALYAWKGQVSAATAIALATLLIIPGEEIVWRGAVLLPLAGRFGPWAGILLGASGFAAAHAGFGSSLLLLAALSCGSCWGWLAIKTRSLVPAIACHLLWDLTVLFWLPY